MSELQEVKFHASDGRKHLIFSFSPDRLFITMDYWNHSRTAIKADHFALTKDEALRVANDILDRYRERYDV